MKSLNVSTMIQVAGKDHIINVEISQNKMQYDIINI